MLLKMTDGMTKLPRVMSTIRLAAIFIIWLSQWVLSLASGKTYKTLFLAAKKCPGP